MSDHNSETQDQSLPKILIGNLEEPPECSSLGFEILSWVDRLV